MNIFYLDENPHRAAMYHSDVHVRKMLLESAQLLSTAHRVLDGKETIKLDKAGRRRKTWIFEDEREDQYYKSTHVNHPSAIWVRQSSRNYSWLLDLYIYLGAEYEYRFERKHKSQDLWKALVKFPDNIPITDYTKVPCAMPEHCILTDDPVINYRNYYVTEKSDLLTYTKREKPEWMER